MDLKVYYRKIRAQEANIAEPDALLMSLETPEGGKEGVWTEAPRLVAAEMVVDGRARLATPEERAQYEATKRAAKKAADEKAEINKVRIALVNDVDLRGVRGSGKQGK